MPALKIRYFDDPVLRQKARPIDRIEERHHRLARDLTDTMYLASGIGLAANQVGVLERMIVLDVQWARAPETSRPNPQPTVMLNPEIVEESVEDAQAEEGCLSLPGIVGDVWRATRVLVRFQRLTGETVELECRDLLARCVQHEIDHLHGVLFIDRVPEAQRRALAGPLRKLARATERTRQPVQPATAE